MNQDTEAERKRTARTHLIFGIACTCLIAGLIAAMFFIDYYAEQRDGGVPKVHDAAEP